MQKLVAFLSQDMGNKLIIGLFLILFFSMPFVILLLNPSTRNWFKGAIEQHDNRLDPEDINRLARIVAFTFSLIMMGFMIVSSAIIEVEYPLEAWIGVILIVAGAEGIVIAQILKRR